jgi:hypothetical protein
MNVNMSNPAPALAPASAPSFNDAMFNSDALPDSSSSTASLVVRGALIFILLALIGFNVFTYLDDITEWLSATFGAPFRAVARSLGYAAIDTAQYTIDVAAKGSKSAVDIAAGAATSGIDVLQKTINRTNRQEDQPIQSQSQSQRQSQSQSQNQDIGSSDALQQALSHAKNEPPQPDDATSQTQRNQRSGKSGYCYIGEDRGFRSCIQIGEQDTCMSGDIFPTHAICVNPRLRK